MSSFYGVDYEPAIDPDEVLAAPPEDERHLRMADEDPEVERERHVRTYLPLVDWNALWSDDDEAEEWILEPLLPARRLVALYSAPKVGKSLLLLEIAVAISLGTGVLGVRIDRPRRVLYVDYENDPRGDVRVRLEAMGYGPEHLANLAYLSYPALDALDTPRGGRQLLAAVEVYGCEVVVIDTVSRAVRGEENDNDTWLQFYRHTGLALKKAGITTVRLDHEGKDAAKGQRGGSAKAGDVDAIWRLSRTATDTFRLTCEASRGVVAETELVLTRESNPLRHKVEASGWMAANDALMKDVIAALDAAGAARSVGRPAAREVLKAAQIRVSNGVLDRALKVRRADPVSHIGQEPADADPVSSRSASEEDE